HKTGVIVERAIVVKRLQVDEVKLGRRARKIDEREVLLAGGQSRGKNVSIAFGIQLLAELFQQSDKVNPVLRCGGKLPVDIEAVKNSGYRIDGNGGLLGET